MTSKSASIMEMEAAILHLLNFRGSGLSADDFSKCAIGAIRETAKIKNPSIQILEREFEARRNESLGVPVSMYYAVNRCLFSIPGDFDFWLPIKLWKDRAVISHRAPSFFNGNDFFLSGYGSVRPSEPRFGAYISLGPIFARSKDDALEKAYSSISKIFGLISYYQSLGVSTHYVGHSKPLTSMLLGKEIVIYDSKFTRIEDEIAYVPAISEHTISLQRREIDRMCLAFHLFEGRGRVDSDLQDYWQHALELYYAAVSEIRDEDQLVGLWRCAEFVTFSNGKSAEISKRLSLAWKDRAEVYALCEAIGHQRNLIIHSEGQRLPVGSLGYAFRGILDGFLRRAFAFHMPSLEAWKVAVEIASGNLTASQLKTALPALKGLSWWPDD